MLGIMKFIGLGGRFLSCMVDTIAKRTVVGDVLVVDHNRHRKTVRLIIGLTCISVQVLSGFVLCDLLRVCSPIFSFSAKRSGEVPQVSIRVNHGTTVGNQKLVSLTSGTNRVSEHISG